MPARRFTIFAALSLVLFALGIAGWTRTWLTPHGWRLSTGVLGQPGYQVQYGVGMNRSSIGFDRNRWGDHPDDRALGLQDRVRVEFAGFGVYYIVKTQSEYWVSFQGLRLPNWLCPLAAIPPVIWWSRFGRAKARGFEVAPIPTC